MIPPVLLNPAPVTAPGLVAKSLPEGDFTALLQPAPLLITATVTPGQAEEGMPLTEELLLPEAEPVEPDLSDLLPAPPAAPSDAPLPAQSSLPIFMGAPLSAVEELPPENLPGEMMSTVVPEPLTTPPAAAPVMPQQSPTVSAALPEEAAPASGVAPAGPARHMPDASTPRLRQPQAPLAEAALPASRPAADPVAAAPLQTEAAVQAEPAQPATLTQLPAETPLRSAEAPAVPAAPVSPQAAPRSTLTRNVFERLDEMEHSEGRTRVLLRPQGLGILEIDVTRLADGRMQVSLRAENPLVLQALQQDASTLSDYLGARGFDMAGGGPDLGRYSRPAPADAGSASAEGAEPDEDTAADPATPARQGAGQLDIVT